MLATAGDCIKLWDSSKFTLLHTIPSSSGGADVARLSWSNDGSCLASASDRGNEVALRVIKGTSTLDLPSVKGLNSPAVGIAYANKAACYLAVAESAGRVLVWDVKQRAQKKVYMLKERGGSNTLSSVVFSPSDSHIAVGTDAGSVQLLSVTNNTVTGPHQLFQDKSRVTCLTYSLARRGLLGASSASGGVCYLDVHSGRVSQASQGHKAPCHSLAFSPINDLLLVSAGYDKKILCYNVNTSKTAQVVTCGAPVTSVGFLPGGQAVCAGTLTGEVVVHDLRSIRVPVSRWQAHASHVTCLALQPHSSGAGTGSLRGTPSTNKKSGDSRSSKSSSVSSKLSPDNQSGGTPVTPSTLPRSVNSNEIPNPVHSSASGREAGVKGGCGSSAGVLGGCGTSAGVLSSMDLLDTSEMLSPVRTDASPSIISPLNPHLTGISDHRSRNVAAGTLPHREGMHGGNATAAANDHVNISDADIYEDDGLLSPVKSDPTFMASLKMITRTASTASPATSLEEKRSSAGHSPSGSSSAAVSCDAPPLYYAGATPHRISDRRQQEEDVGTSCPLPLDGQRMASAADADQIDINIEEAEGDYEDELLSPVRNLSTPRPLLQCGPGTPLAFSSAAGVPKFSVATPSKSPSRVSHLLPSDHQEPSTKQSSKMTPLHASQSRKNPETSSSKLIHNSYSRNVLVGNKENVPLDLADQLPSLILSPSSNVDSGGKQSPRVDRVATHGAALPHRSVRSLNITTSGKDTPLKNLPLQSLSSKGNTSSATSNNASVEDLQKKYHSIVARMNQDNELQFSRASTSNTLHSSGVVTTDSTSSSGLDLERLADLVAARLSGCLPAVTPSSGISPKAAAASPSGLSPSSAAVTSDSLSASLVRSCVSDVMDEVEAGINRRFMHLHYTLLTHLMEQTREIEELHKKYSLNNELLDENLRLQEEIKYLKSSY